MLNGWSKTILNSEQSDFEESYNFLNKVNMNMLDVELVSYKKCMKYN